MSNGSKAKLLTFALLLIFSCGAVSFFVSHWASRRDDWKHDQTHGHEWLRKEIGLSDEEYDAINSFEAEYRQRRDELLTQYNARIGDLRQLLLTHDEFAPEVEHAIHELHVVHGELQELSIRHYYDMLRVLPPEKQGRLRQVATDALSEPE